MKTLLLSCFILLSVTLHAQTAKFTDKGVPYYEYVDPVCADGNCPIVVFLHGFGERGDGTLAKLPKVKAQGLPKLLEKEVNKYVPGYIALVPQQKEPNSGYITDPKNPFIVNVLTYFDKTYKYDGRLMLGGLSMGAGGSWDASFNYLITIGLVDAIVPVSGGGDYNGAKETARRGVYVWAIHGDADKDVPISTGWRGVGAMLLIINPPKPVPTIATNFDLGLVKWTIIPGGTHSSNVWDIAFSLKPQPLLGNTTIYEWFKSKFQPQQIPICGVIRNDSVYLDNGWKYPSFH